MSSLNFEQKRQELLERRNSLVIDGRGNVDLRTFKKEFSELFEALIFDLISTKDGDSFFGNIMINLGRKFNYCIPTPVNHQVVNMNVVLHINPFLLIEYGKEQMKELIRHEIYHIIGQHAKRSEAFVGSVDSKILALACDLVANKMANITNAPAWTYSVLKDKFGINLNDENSLEENVKQLTFIVKENKLFADYIGMGESTYYDVDDEDHSVEDIVEYNHTCIVYGYSMDSVAIVISEGVYDEDDLESYDEDIEAYPESLSPFYFEASKSSDMDILEDFIRKIIVEASSNSRGLLPSGVQSIINELNAPPKISWQNILCKRLGSLPVPYKKTFLRNDRRQPNRLELRGRICDRVPKLYLAIDTSGSVSDMEIEYIITEINAISKAYKADVTVIECDADVQRVYDIKQGQGKAKRDVSGRGGTSFTPVIRHLRDELKASNDSICIYFTDGGGEREIPKVPCQMLWVLTRDDSLSVNNPQGRILYLNEDVRFEKYKNSFLG